MHNNKLKKTPAVNTFLKIKNKYLREEPTVYIFYVISIIFADLFNSDTNKEYIFKTLIIENEGQYLH